MAEKSDYTEIKAGVDGMIGDVPSPTDAPEPTTEEMPETQNSEESIQEQTTAPLMDFSNQSQNTAPQMDSDRIHQIVEAIVSEKFDEMMSGVGNLSVWKEKINNDVIAIKQEILRSNERFDNLQNAILGRIKEYDQGMQGVSTEMKALEKVFEKIVEPLTTNIKELDRLVKEMKTSKK
ncbi:hypothetical protein J4476_00185 [Candidatus Woesearchaeota archaeon]|nr:MAG: hypothetical protein QT09_C0010G0009 [archaeon GW2011_AR18]MBS3161102.1 hypothetical protein [Candidatus Woesearchaeota archaeon]HIH25510.1 hypothetical protein [Nanoarchaeota archaeon]